MAHAPREEKSDQGKESHGFSREEDNAFGSDARGFGGTSDLLAVPIDSVSHRVEDRKLD